MAQDGPGCVVPVVIPLAPTQVGSRKEERTVCPVRALPYYLDRTKDLIQGKELLFVSSQKDFVPDTVSSWIKQTVFLCDQLSDEDAQRLHQVRAHDV